MRALSSLLVIVRVKVCFFFSFSKPVKRRTLFGGHPLPMNEQRDAWVNENSAAGFLLSRRSIMCAFENHFLTIITVNTLCTFAATSYHAYLLCGNGRSWCFVIPPPLICSRIKINRHGWSGFSSDCGFLTTAMSAYSWKKKSLLPHLSFFSPFISHCFTSSSLFSPPPFSFPGR